MERKFFSTVRIIVVGITVLAFISAAACVIFGLVKSNSTVETSLKSPKASYDDMLQAKKAQKEAQKHVVAGSSTPQQQRPQSNPDDIPLEYLQTLTNIEISLKMFARDTLQAEPTNDTRKKIFKSAKNLAPEIPIATSLGLLETEAKKLVADASRITALPLDDPEYVMWGDFLRFFFQALGDDLDKQKQVIRVERERVEKEKADGSRAFHNAMSSFYAFIALIFCLLLLNLERNTYLIRAALDAKADTVNPPTQPDAHTK